MKTEPYNYLRFNKRPPGKKPPPRSEIDLRYDADRDGFVFENANGVETPVGGDGSVQYDPAIVSETGGGATKLDGIATVNATLSRVQAVNSSLFGFFRLSSGTDVENDPLVIRPDDYATTTNEKVWKLMNLHVDQLVVYGSGTVFGTMNFQDGIGVTGGITTGTIKTTSYTVATLPTPAVGMRAQVTDSNVAAAGNFGATVAGGGANVVPVFYNGTNWIIA